MSVEDTLVRMAQDKTPPEMLTFNRSPHYTEDDCLWVSKPHPSRTMARQLAELAIGTIGREVAAYPKAIAVKDGAFWRGVVYAGRRTRREAAKEQG